MAIITLPTNLADVDASGDFKLPVADEYTFEVKKAEVKQSQAGNTMVNLGLQIIDDEEFAGTYVWETLVFTEKAMFRVKQFMLACGLDISMGEIDPADWIGCEFNATTAIEEFEYKGEDREKAVIKSYKFEE